MWQKLQLWNKGIIFAKEYQIDASGQQPDTGVCC